MHGAATAAANGRLPGRPAAAVALLAAAFASTAAFPRPVRALGSSDFSFATWVIMAPTTDSYGIRRFDYQTRGAGGPVNNHELVWDYVAEGISLGEVRDMSIHSPLSFFTMLVGGNTLYSCDYPTCSSTVQAPMGLRRCTLGQEFESISWDARQAVLFLSGKPGTSNSHQLFSLSVAEVLKARYSDPVQECAPSLLNSFTTGNDIHDISIEPYSGMIVYASDSSQNNGRGVFTYKTLTHGTNHHVVATWDAGQRPTAVVMRTYDNRVYYATSTSDQIWSVTFGNYVDYTETSVATIGFTGSSKLLLETRTSTLAVLTSAQDVRFTDTSSIVSHVRAIAMAFECQPGCPAPYQVWCQTQECGTCDASCPHCEVGGTACCRPLFYYDSTSGSEGCKACPSCGSGEFELSECSLFSPSSCVTCPSAGGVLSDVDDVVESVHLEVASVSAAAAETCGGVYVPAATVSVGGDAWTNRRSDFVVVASTSVGGGATTASDFDGGPVFVMHNDGTLVMRPHAIGRVVGPVDVTVEVLERTSGAVAVATPSAVPLSVVCPDTEAGAAADTGTAEMKVTVVGMSVSQAGASAGGAATRMDDLALEVKAQCGMMTLGTVTVDGVAASVGVGAGSGVQVTLTLSTPVAVAVPRASVTVDASARIGQGLEQERIAWRAAGRLAARTLGLCCVVEQPEASFMPPPPPTFSEPSQLRTTAAGSLSVIITNGADAVGTAVGQTYMVYTTNGDDPVSSGTMVSTASGSITVSATTQLRAATVTDTGPGTVSSNVVERWIVVDDSACQ